MMYINPGHTIIYPSFKIESKIGCGIIPIGQEVKAIYTQGLKWNFGSAADKIGCQIDMATFISTSN